MEFASVTFSNLRWGTAMWVWILGMRNDEAVLLSASPGQTFLFSLYILSFFLFFLDMWLLNYEK